MSVASEYRTKWDRAIKAVEGSYGLPRDKRNLRISRELSEAGYVLVPRQMITSYQRVIAELRSLLVQSRDATCDTQNEKPVE